MGTTLTGTTPQDTYDSLIKVTDNGPLSGTLKALSDGLGNDSTLSLSTTAASIAGTLAVAGSATFDTTTLVVDATNDRVGIGTSSPANKLSVSGGFIQATDGTRSGLYGSDGNGLLIGATTNHYFRIITNDIERFRATETGLVGIGTSVPASKLHVAGADAWMTLQRTSGTTNILDFTDSAAARLGYVGFIGSNLTINAKAGSDIIFAPNNLERARFTSNGLTFNGDTLQVNALDDYEEGTFNFGISFGGASVDVTYANNAGTYTKIGRQVTVNGVVTLTSKGSSTGTASITGLPFTIANTNGNYSIAALRLNNITFANQFQGVGDINSTNIVLQEVSEAGALTDITNADFANNSQIMLSLTYFV